ncbi:hypothetical protein V8D89_006260 [Ganoderma adspersum]
MSEERGIEGLNAMEELVLAGAAAEQLPRKRTRKGRNDGASSSGSDGNRKGKRRRGAGSLSEMMNMPLDVFFELCGVERAKWVDYAIRLRLCKACYKANIRKGSSILGKRQMHLFRTLPLFPCETRLDNEKAQTFASPENRTAENKYYASYVNTLLDEYTSLERKDPEAAKLAMQETLEEVALAQLHAVVVMTWTKRNYLLKALADMQVMMDRKSKIIERLKGLGYTADDFPEGEDAWKRLVRQPKPLTDRIWNNIRPKLEEQIALEKERRIEQDFQDRVDERLDVILQWYEEYLEEHYTAAERGLFPSMCDARELPSLVALAQANDARDIIPRSAFLARIEQVLADVEEYKTRAKRALVDLLRNNHECRPQLSEELKDVPVDDVLQRYCAYFTCPPWCNATPAGGCEYLTYEQLHGHWRVKHYGVPWMRGPEDDTWARASVAALWPYFLPAVGRSVLEAVGIQPDTPRTVLDGWAKEGRLFCACGHPGMALPGEMDWAKLLSHLMEEMRRYRSREVEMMRLYGRHNPNHVLRDCHSLVAGDDCCVKFLPEGADTAAASVRATIGDMCRAQVEAKLAAPPEPGAYPVCRICKGLTRKTPLQVRLNLSNMELPDRPEEIVWHLRTCHGKEFEKRDILFIPVHL